MKNLKKLSRNELKSFFGGISLSLEEGSPEGTCSGTCKVVQGNYTIHGNCVKGKGIYSYGCFCDAVSSTAKSC
jgi:hypothetical protein